MRRVLFVDDEQLVLDGLRNMLRKQRKEWEMVFALGARPALEALAQGPFDVVVSDMRMPGMDGAQLLEKVKELQPGASRIVLSGHAEREAAIRASAVAHQYLSKPCESEALLAAVNRTCELKRLIDNDRFRTLVGKLTALPPAPRLFAELTATINRDGVTMREVSTIIETDPAMTAKVLQLVNSAYFGLAQRVTSVQQAVSYLGLELVKALVLSAHVFSSPRSPLPKGFDLDRLQARSLQVAKLAKEICTDAKVAADAFTAGLMHDLGLLVIAVGMPADFEAVEAQAARVGVPTREVSLVKFGTTHAEIGAYLLGVWGVPFVITEAVAYHHRPAAVAVTPYAPVTVAVHVAAALVEELAAAPGAVLESALDEELLTKVGLIAKLPEWRRRAGELFGADTKKAACA